MGSGAQLVVKLSGGGGLLCGGPLSHYLGYTLNEWSLVLKHFLCWGGGGNVTFDVYNGFPPHRWCLCGIRDHFGM